jgi:asparagine synthase (glutamine-hydrolysing)
MCGIAGFSRRGEEDEAVQRLWTAMARRGPDGRWSRSFERMCLVQTRLAVIDRSPRVVYPMPNEQENAWLLFNGEIYDFPKLRDELIRSGHAFSTDCDAEVVIHAYEEWGTDCFRKLNGMFAAAILDERTGELVLARDRFGIKPLVRTVHGPLAFASDALALVASGLVCPTVDAEAVAQYLELGYVPPPRTGIAGVEQVAPGSAVVVAPTGETRVVNSAPQELAEPPAGDVSLDEVDASLRQAVESQLVADVDVGVFLSSGIDSALVLSYAVEAGARPKAFTIGFPGHGDYDEATQAHRVASTLGVRHEVERFSTPFAEAIDVVASAFDSPFGDASAVATLAVARLASSRVTVALTGTGGDELFAGYYRHRAHRLQPLFRFLPEGPRRALVQQIPAAGSERRSGLRLARSYAGRLAAARGGSDIDQYLALIGSRSTLPSRLVSVEVDPALAMRRVALEHGLVDGARAPTRLRQLQQFELATYLPGDLLAKEDRAAMYWGVEGRVPMLDNRVSAAAARLRDTEKASLLRGKLPLRALAKRRLPRRLNGRKRGFAVPLGPLLEGPWRTECVEWLRNCDSSLVGTSQVADLLCEGVLSPHETWALAALAAWERRLAAL